MGLLSEGSPLTWEETKRHAEHVRKHGIKQFITQYKKLKGRTRDVLYWGDEVEYMLVKFDHSKKKTQLSLKAQDVLQALVQRQTKDYPATWHPEYADYMVEGTPGKPYGCLMAHFNLVERSMKLRREEIQSLLEPDEEAMSITVFPRLGCPNFTVPTYEPTPTSGASRSLFFPDEAINSGHPRFKTLTRNIRERRGEKVTINVPVYKDVNTEDPFIEDFSVLGDDGEAQRAAKPDNIYMDCMGFGMGNSCLQVTFQACNIDEARLLYDQLTTLCPMLLALSAASPIFRGHLADIEARWTVIAQGVDDRTREELGLEPLKENKFCINKSRYDSIDSYLSPGSACYNDIDMVYDKDLYQQLRDGGVDELLSRHLAHLFIRDPISLFSEKIDQNDDEDTDHFENIQSTNWQTMRFKPPPPNSDIGWRVEFRPMEVQLTDFENAAYVVFIVLLTRVILTFKLNFLIPISKVDENMKTASKRDAVRQGRFYFRKDVVTDCSPPEAAECMVNCEKAPCKCIADEYTLMSIDEIINGKGDFVGLLSLMNKYMDSVETDVDTRCTVLQYLQLISKRASGELMTTARWVRELVNNHPDYKHDSVVSDSIAYDILSKCAAFSRESTDVPELLFSYSTKSADTIPLAVSKAQQYYQEKSKKK
ncbi:glutamate--cysteine ligase catalytic subunit-like [Haliotis rubra]|uniref:glutamate--cysteine ligase catalytic subunit-like n=1 Tax=Haliotis rubra TaxID=36100 RepID=UPI001EE57451|nr:glutamate--cysteine ligase catalytic subunit-like [Haliotis rubra]